MPVIKSVKKALRSSLKKKAYNDRRKDVLKKTLKVIKVAKKADPKSLSDAYKALDKAAKRGIIKKNTASRKKSRLAKMMNGMGK